MDGREQKTARRVMQTGRRLTRVINSPAMTPLPHSLESLSGNCLTRPLPYSADLGPSFRTERNAPQRGAFLNPVAITAPAAAGGVNIPWRSPRRQAVERTVA